MNSCILIIQNIITVKMQSLLWKQFPVKAILIDFYYIILS